MAPRFMAKLRHCAIGNRWLPRNTHAFKTVMLAPGIGAAMQVPVRGAVAAILTAAKTGLANRVHSFKFAGPERKRA